MDCCNNAGVVDISSAHRYVFIRALVSYVICISSVTHQQ